MPCWGCDLNARAAHCACRFDDVGEHLRAGEFPSCAPAGSRASGCRATGHRPRPGSRSCRGPRCRRRESCAGGRRGSLAPDPSRRHSCRRARRGIVLGDGDDAELLDPVHLSVVGDPAVLDPVPWLATRSNPCRLLVGVEDDVDRGVPDRVCCDLPARPVLDRTGPQGSSPIPVPIPRSSPNYGPSTDSPVSS